MQNRELKLSSSSFGYSNSNSLSIFFSFLYSAAVYDLHNTNNPLIFYMLERDVAFINLPALCLNV